MAQATAGMTGKPLIESDRVEGTAVYDPQGNNLGKRRLCGQARASMEFSSLVRCSAGALGIALGSMITQDFANDAG